MIVNLWIEKSEENAIKIYQALEEFGLPYGVNASDFLEPNRIDILTDIDG